MQALSSAATHCKFEASDSVSDEIVLLKILQLLRVALVSDAGSVLSDESVCAMIETGLSMCCQMQLSGNVISPLVSGSLSPQLNSPPPAQFFPSDSARTEMLRRSAEYTMVTVTQTMFER